MLLEKVNGGLFLKLEHTIINIIIIINFISLFINFYSYCYFL